ncbi:hypothetical protein [Sodalis glossinidius]|uniref:hypothetical protein n=1 Tax=Sodalis glossinidius TaxID=63612 RepID=UPI001413082F|nr:hypothetical protein [Sodalis glossinidius]
MKQLDFTLSLIDKLTRPLKQAQASVSDFAEKSRTAFSHIGLGAAGLVGAGLSIKGALGPAMAFDEALKSASARGMDDNTLARVGRTPWPLARTMAARPRSLSTQPRLSAPRWGYSARTSCPALRWRPICWRWR